MTPNQQYLVEEVGEDFVDGLITRREALRRLALLGLGLAASTSFLAACAERAAQSPSPSPPSPAGTPSPESTAAVPTEAIEFPGPDGRKLQGAFAAARDSKGGVLVIHENRGLTDHIRSVAGRLAGSGYSSLAIDLLSEEGGTAALPDDAARMAALGRAPAERLVADMRAGIDELGRRLSGAKLGAIGFCFGGGQVWQLADAEPRLAAAAPFYGPFPSGADFSGTKVAVLGIYAESDTRVNATREDAKAALEKANLNHEFVTLPGDHAFFNDTGPRYNASSAQQAYAKVLDWFERYLA